MNEQDLNPTISGYIAESNAHHLQAVATRFTPNAVVVDEGGTHVGIDQVRSWIEKTHSEYHFELEPLEFSEQGNETVVTCVVSGSFPGSPIRLRFFFTLVGEKIAALTIRE